MFLALIVILIGYAIWTLITQDDASECVICGIKPHAYIHEPENHHDDGPCVVMECPSCGHPSPKSATVGMAVFAWELEMKRVKKKRRLQAKVDDYNKSR